MTQNNIAFPIRINTYLARTGVCTRKYADVLVSQGKVFINKKRAPLGAMVQKNDLVEVKNAVKKEFVYVLWSKPRDVTTPDSKIIQSKGKDIKTYTIGRLDKETDGLILLSNDTRLSERLLNPKYNHEKEYEVSVREDIVPAQLQKLVSGVRVSHEGRKLTVKAKVAEKKGSNTLKIVLTEGKKHQVRQMCAAVHLTVAHLRRIRIQELTIGELRNNQTRELSEAEVLNLLQSVGLA
jgi:23S rRNA pseudouridine2604 synthase